MVIQYIKLLQYISIFFFFDGLTQNRIYETSCAFRMQTCNNTIVSRSFIRKQRGRYFPKFDNTTKNLCDIKCNEL